MTAKISAQLFHPEYDVIKIRELYRLEGADKPAEGTGRAGSQH